MLRSFSLSIVCLLVLVSMGCQTSPTAAKVSIWLQPDAPALIDFPLAADLQVYGFQTTPNILSYMSLSSLSPDLTYTADVIDGQGSVVATLTNRIAAAVLTLDSTSAFYQVALRAGDKKQVGRLSLQLTHDNRITTTRQTASAAAVIPTLTFDQPLNQPVVLTRNTTTVADTLCRAASASGLNINIRSGPGLDYPVIDTLAVTERIVVSGRTASGWYRVDVNEQPGWISSTVVTVAGNCASLPDMSALSTVLRLPRAGAAVIPFNLSIDRDGWGSLNEALSSADPLARDLIDFSAYNLVAGDFHEYTLSLICSGSGLDAVRWGAPQNPTLLCGSSTTLPLTAGTPRLTLTVTLVNPAPLSDVDYTLMAVRKA
jgi:hypothetical protein